MSLVIISLTAFLIFLIKAYQAVVEIKRNVSEKADALVKNNAAYLFATFITRRLRSLFDRKGGDQSE